MLNKYKPNTQRAYYIAIVSCLGVSKDDKKATKLYSKYYKLMNDKAKEIKETPTEDMTETKMVTILTKGGAAVDELLPQKDSYRVFQKGGKVYSAKLN